MVIWNALTGDNAENWDKNLLSFPDFSLFQTFSWGEYRGRFGWQPHRWAAYDEQGRIIAMVQALVRLYPLKTGLVWAPGGPVGNLSAIGSGFFSFLKRITGLKRVFCRFYPIRTNNEKDASILAGSGMTKARHPINSGLSMLYNLSQDMEMPKATKNWRHNLKRSEKHGLIMRMWEHPDIEEILSIYKNMETMKNINRQYSREELAEIFETVGEKIALYRCDNANGDMLGFRGCAIVGDKGWDLFAAVTAEGRKVYASYALFDALIRHCRTAGVVHYDMGGVDPAGNPGVYDFKKGTGAILQEYLGEWDWATSYPLRLAANWAISSKRGNI